MGTFLSSAALYDAVYHFKDYAKEARRLVELIDARVPGARTILDVACGTGMHAMHLASKYSVDGIDLNDDYLSAARSRNPAGRFERADMTDFNLAREYDVVTCLFSAIGYLKNVAAMRRAIAAMARHAHIGGLVIVEPWLTPNSWRIGDVFVFGATMPDGRKVVRMSRGGRAGNLSVIELRYLVGGGAGIEDFRENIELALFTRAEMTEAFESATLSVEYDEGGLMGRGLYIGRRRG